MKTETLHPVTDYIQTLFNSLGLSESFSDVPYFDTANPPRATIGYGVNIEAETGYLSLVLYQMDIIGEKTWGQALT